MRGALLLLLFGAAAYFVTLLHVEAVKVRGTEPRLVAFGDIHGDVFRCRQILQLANITDTEDRWIAGSSIVVQLGDIADRGLHPHEIYDLFASLERQAMRAGGEFIFLVGNHELMNILGIFYYVHPDVMSAFGGEEAYAAAFGPEGPYGLYILQHPVAVVREGVVFAHAGITPEYAAKGVEGINAELMNGFRGERDLLLEGDAKGDGVHTLSNSSSPLWSRAVLDEAKRGNCSLLMESLRLLSVHELASGRPPVRVMVGGHTVQEGGVMAVECNGSLVGADVGLSRFFSSYGGYVAYVEFVLDDSDPPRRIAVPQYPFGRAVRPPTPPLLKDPMRPPRRMPDNWQPPSVRGEKGEGKWHRAVKRRTKRGDDGLLHVSVQTLCFFISVLAFFWFASCGFGGEELRMVGTAVGGSCETRPRLPHSVCQLSSFFLIYPSPVST
ncbi:serine/threonine protein phosphatase, putative [Trypanosoma cruzi]|uniref:Serine/threonine protein phosphatase n=1 Tax=Trypanosoma cruzi Dm28c TaxID=1416333 RepID=V5BPY7_TRYCR|nr:serine/threonine protein phosphatase, putative [Trypanosoma cruzi]ESS68232.1 serine/threonine protein phosphatase [Trypanosoma cruzi Dm28c]